jgi:O-acetyl-ADP-ribose deacetylase (regulator of RNase III)
MAHCDFEISVVNGDIFKSKCDTIVIPVNIVGVMGKGLALEFRKKYPELYDQYRTLCFTGTLQLGKPYKIGKFIFFPTKQDWKKPSRIEWIKYGMKYLVDNWKEMKIGSIALPKLGCGLGGLIWEDVFKIINQHLKTVENIKAEIYV